MQSQENNRTIQVWATITAIAAAAAVATGNGCVICFTIVFVIIILIVTRYPILNTDNCRKYIYCVFRASISNIFANWEIDNL